MTNSPSSTTKPSSGTIVSCRKGKKSFTKSTMGIELDFYPGFFCCKPKLNWNLAKFDYSQAEINWFTPTVKNIHTVGLPVRGTHVHNLEFSLINPCVFTLLPLVPNTSGQETKYQAQIEHLQALPSTLVLDTDYWGSVTTTSLLPSLTSCASTPESEYHRSQALAFPPIPDVCLCGIDICYCDAPVPNTPLTPNYILNNHIL